MRIESEIKILSWYQMIGGLVGIWALIQYTFQVEAFTGYAVLPLFFIFLLYLFSVGSGVILLKSHKAGILLSKINQFLQIIGFALAGYGFQYISGLKLSIGVDVTESMLFKFDLALPSFNYGWNTGSEDAFVYINIVPMIVIYLLGNIDFELGQDKSPLEMTLERHQ